MATIGLAACSNPVAGREEKLAELVGVFEGAGYRVDTRFVERFAGHEQRVSGGSGGSGGGSRVWRINPRVRAELLTELFADSAVHAIFDITGGDLANEVLEWVDWDVVSANPKPFAGYSDVSVVVNALVVAGSGAGRLGAGRTATLWNPWTALKRGADDVPAILARKHIRPACDRELPDLPIIGGNVRCLAKLGGTRWWPRATGHLALLEGMATTLEAVTTYTEQLRQLGLFRGAEGLILGQFTDIDAVGQRGILADTLREITGLDVWHAPEIGHSRDSAPVTIG